MKTQKKIFKIPFELLEDLYWNEASFCLSCERFFSLEEKEKTSFSNECPSCHGDELFDVDFLMKKELLMGID